MVEEFKGELNPVYKHKLAKCGHVFSPGDPWIIEAYLAGDLIPLAALDNANQLIKILREQLAEEQAKTNDQERRVSIA